MIEVVISIAVIAFAIVAIIGVLPTGLRSQQQTHEDTIVNQDGPYFLEMIRGGVHGLDHLTNYVEWIQISNNSGAAVYVNGNFPLSVPPPGTQVGQLVDGEIILRLLSTPKYIGAFTNTVSAYVHSLSGGATEQGRASRDLGFGYLLTTEIMPATNLFPITSMTFSTNDPSLANLERSNRWLSAQQLSPDVTQPTKANLFDVRVTCRWPYRPNFTTGNKRQVYRSLVSATLTNVPLGFYFLPQQFAEIK